MLIAPIILVSGCSLLSSDNQPTSTTTPITHYYGDAQPPLTNTLSGNTNEYTLLFSGVRTETVTFHHVARQQDTIYFINSDAKKIQVKVSFPDNMTGNLRRSQVIMPDGQADGPFGTDTEYDLTQFGGYQLIFNENMMAGDPRSGDVQITITLL